MTMNDQISLNKKFLTIYDGKTEGQTMDKSGPVIYCIEGVHDWGKARVEPTVEPMLQQLQAINCWNYVRRDCATMQELEWYLKNEWMDCEVGSILYFCSHGSDKLVNLSGDTDISIDQIAIFLGESGGQQCLVHFGGCETFKKIGDSAMVDFMDKTGTWAVSGYGNESFWSGVRENAVALEFMLFSKLGPLGDYRVGYKYLDHHVKNLNGLRDELRDIFDPLDFQMRISK